MAIFIKYLLVILGVYFLVKWIFRGIFSYFVGNATEDHMSRQKEAFVRNQKKREGKVTVNFQPKSSKNIRKEEGDYVDFEEVK